jgi:hypothetical protein
MTKKTTQGATGVWDFYDTDTGKYLYSYEGFLSNKKRIKFYRDGFIRVNLSPNFTPFGQAPTTRVFDKELHKALTTGLDNK